MARQKKYSDVNDADGIDEGVLHLDDSLYPVSLKQILGKHAPTALYYKGNLALLMKQGVGFCGSRNASDKGLDTAKDCAEQVADESLVVISGNASGVDLVAHRTALEKGGSTILVLPEGMNHFRIKKELRDMWDWPRVLVITQFKPTEIWQAYRAMTRNQVIIGLSKAMIVIEAQEKGGTIEAGKSALKLKVPLFVAEYQDMTHTPGNVRLLEMGAATLKKRQSAGRAKLTSLFEVIENFKKTEATRINQLNLF